MKSQHVAKYGKLIAKIGVGVGLTAMLSGCLLTSPYWNQEFADHTKPIPIQTWTVYKTPSVKIECSQAFHGGLYPPFNGSWSFVTNLSVQQTGVLDPRGNKVYSAGAQMILPSNCWRPENTSAGIRYYAAIRASQPNSSGTKVEFSVFDNNGLECLGRENGKAASWFGWLNKGCAKTYSNSTTKIPFVIFRAKT